jgi:hypothetical protein
MSAKDLFENRSPEEVEALFDNWAGRDFEDIPIDTFFATLEEIETQRPPQCIEMEGEIVGGKLVFMPPKDVPLPFTVRDNEIILDDYTIRVHLQSVDDTVPTVA